MKIRKPYPVKYVQEPDSTIRNFRIMNPEEKTTNHHRHVSGSALKRVDLQYLSDLSGGDTEFIIEVIDMFLGIAPDSVKNVLTYEKNGNYTLIKSTVHKLKPTLQMLGDSSLHELAVKIEDASLNNGPADDAARVELRGWITTFVKDSHCLIKELEQVSADLKAGKL